MPSDYETHDTDEDVLSCTCCYVVEKLMPKVTELKMETEKRRNQKTAVFFFGPGKVKQPENVTPTG